MKKMNLGKELSKNEQKKVLGGYTVHCYTSNRTPQNTYHGWPGSCSDYPGLTAYCKGVNGSLSIVSNCY